MNVYRSCVLGSILLVLFFHAGCENQSASVSPTPTAVPSTPTAIPTPLPTATPAPTPVPEGPDFRLIRLNREMMNPDQIHKYGQDMAGKKIAGWIGYFHQTLETEESGKSRIVVDMDENAAGLPDVVLENIPSEIAAQLQPRQGLNFSGTIQGYVAIPENLYTLSLGDVSLYGF